MKTVTSVSHSFAKYYHFKFVQLIVQITQMIVINMNEVKKLRSKIIALGSNATRTGINPPKY